MARPFVSVIVAAQNETDRMPACLEAIESQRTKLPFEVLWVDHGTKGASLRTASKLTQKLRRHCVLRERRGGCARAFNLGARRARGELLLFLEVDSVPCRDWVEEMARPLLAQSHYPLAAIGGHTKQGYSPSAGPNWLERYLRQLFSQSDHERLAERPSFLPWAPGVNFAVRRDVFVELDGFDPLWKNAGYDVDFCWRLSLCGFVLGYSPKGEVRHQQRSDLRGLLRQMENSAFHKQSLSSLYGKILRIPIASPKGMRSPHRPRRRLPRLSQIKRLDPFSLAFEAQWAVQSRVLGLRPNPRLDRTRAGHTPPRLMSRLTPGYAFLHEQGWSYWKSPADVSKKGHLVLFRPRSQERFRLDPSEWKIWEVKAERGQSEDAALALGKNPEDHEALHTIDEITLDLHTRRLLP